MAAVVAVVIVVIIVVIIMVVIAMVVVITMDRGVMRRCRASAATSFSAPCRALATLVQPVFKILNLDGVSDVGMPDLHGHGGQSASDLADPAFAAQCGEGLGDGFVQGFGRHVDRVCSLVQIVDNDGAGFESHDGNLSYSLFVRLWALAG